MYIKFNSVREDIEEFFNKSKQAEMDGSLSTSIYNEHDYITSIVIDMSLVIDYVQSKVLWNEESLNCIVPIYKGGRYGENLLINEPDFTKIFEKVKGKKVFTPKEVLDSTTPEEFLSRHL